MKPKMIGNINACGAATIFDDKGNAIATCLDTPNSIACAFGLFPQAVSVKSGFPMNISASKKEYEDRIWYAVKDTALIANVKPV